METKRIRFEREIDLTVSRIWRTLDRADRALRELDSLRVPSSSSIEETPSRMR